MAKIDDVVAAILAEIKLQAGREGGYVATGLWGEYEAPDHIIILDMQRLDVEAVAKAAIDAWLS